MKTRHLISFVLMILVLFASPLMPTQASGDFPVYLPAVIKSPPSPGQELLNAYTGAYRGKTVTMLGTFGDADATKFNNSIQEFEQRTGIDIQYTSSNDFGDVIQTLVNNGTPPDIADFPSPSLLATFAQQGKVLDLNKIINPAWLSMNYRQSWLDLSTMPGPNGPITAGILIRVSAKDLVWYPKAAFDAAGYQVPQTWDELMALTEQIANDGSTPWCIGIGSGVATGWPATDWIETLMLRTTTLENYDKWVAGTLKFDSPEVRNAISYMTNIWFNDKYVYGGRSSIATTFFGDTVPPMFNTPPGCWLNKHANFITSFFPANLTPGVDYDFFYLPPIDTASGKPLEVAGDMNAVFNDRPEVRAVIQYFSTGESLKGWIEAGGITAAQNDVPIDWYTSPVEKKIAQMMQQATSFRFDGSDLMPAAVGSGTFWTEITAYVAGTEDLDTALRNIDASWPK